jgi:hypothetical protein
LFFKSLFINGVVDWNDGHGLTHGVMNLTSCTMAFYWLQ